MSRIQPRSVSDDLTHGQIVILIARWILVLAGLLLTLLAPKSLNVLRFQVMVLLILAVANFYLCAQVLMRRAILREVVYGASLADLGVITLIILSQGGFESNTYVFYFPALLAISVAFPTLMLFIFTGGVLAVYAFIGVISLNNFDGDLQILVIRLLMLAAVVVCGNQYWRMERDRRRAVLTAQKPPAVALPETEAAAQA